MNGDEYRTDGGTNGSSAGDRRTAVTVAIIGAVAVVVAAMVTGVFVLAAQRSGTQFTPGPDAPDTVGSAMNPVVTTTRPITTNPPVTTGPSPKRAIRVSCTAPPTSAARGSTFVIVYHVVASGDWTVGVGAGLYDDLGDHSNGDYDEDAAYFPSGTTDYNRTVAVPDDIAPGRYEVAAEIWPANKVGNGETITDSPCGYVKVT